MAAWSLATAGGEEAQPALLALAEAAPVRLMNGQQLATLAWALARLNCKAEDLCVHLL